MEIPFNISYEASRYEKNLSRNTLKSKKSIEGTSSEKVKRAIIEAEKKYLWD